MPGSIRKRGPNRWQLRASMGRNPATGRYQYMHRDFVGTEASARKAAARLAVEVQEGRHQQSDRHTVEGLLNRWMEHIEGLGRAPTTLARYRSAIRHDIVPRLGQFRIDRLQPADIDSFYTALAKSGLKPVSVRKSHTILSAAFNQAIKWGWLERSPVHRASPPSIGHNEVIPPRPDELARILAECERTNQELGSVIYVAVTTGCRRGELCGLRWSDIDLDGATLTVARSISDADGVVEVKGTKTHAIRRLALDAGTIAVLRTRRDRAEAAASAVGVELSPSSYVWSQDVAGREPFRPDRVTGQFVVVRERLGLEHITFHSLRHFAATALAGQGVAVRTIAGRLGHANPTVTLKTYAHFLDVADREAAEKLGDIVGKLLSDSADASPKVAARETPV